MGGYSDALTVSGVSSDYSVRVVEMDYIVLPKEVTVSGEIRRDLTYEYTAYGLLSGGELALDGFVGEDTFAAVQSSVQGLALLDADGNDLLAGTAPGSYAVAQIASTGSNYAFVPGDLTVTILNVGEGMVTLEGWLDTEEPNEPVAQSSTRAQGLEIIYAGQGADPYVDADWSAAQPTEPGAYLVRAVWPAQDGYGRLICTAEFSITSMDVD